MNNPYWLQLLMLHLGLERVGSRPRWFVQSHKICRTRTLLNNCVKCLNVSLGFQLGRQQPVVQSPDIPCSSFQGILFLLELAEVSHGTHTRLITCLKKKNTNKYLFKESGLANLCEKWKVSKRLLKKYMKSLGLPTCGRKGMS